MKSIHRTLIVPVLLGVCMGVASCAPLHGSARSRPMSEGDGVGTSAEPGIDARSLRVLDGRTGGEIGWVGLVARCAGSDVAIIGEVHGHPVGGAASVALFQDILASASGSPALSLEFFERHEQSDVDDYLAGITDEKVFRERTGRTEGNYPEAHRAMVEAAKAGGREVIASNAPRWYASLARKEGFDRLLSLTAAQRRLFEVPESVTDGGYHDRFFELMSGMGASHGAPGSEAPDPAVEQAMIEGFFRAQCVWDATMAASVVQGVMRARSPVVHVVGQFHSDFDGGLVQRIRAMAPSVRMVTVSLVDQAEWTDADRGRADVVVLIGSSPGES